MELVDDIKGILKAAGTQIKSRIIGSEQLADPADESPQENAAEEAKVDNETENQEPKMVVSQSATGSLNPVIDRVFQLRENFVIIGLTGRTGSGCTTVAEKLATKEWAELKSNYKDFNSEPIDNVVRKNRIVHRYLKRHWTQPFDVISASDIIFYYALKEDFDVFANSLASVNIEPDEESKYEQSKPIIDPVLRGELDKLKDDFMIRFVSARRFCMSPIIQKPRKSIFFVVWSLPKLRHSDENWKAY